MKNKLKLIDELANAPSQAEELRIDRNGNFYWSDKGKVAWTKGVKDGNYSSLRSDAIIATLNIDNIKSL
jgi:hypothetical protein